MVLRFGVEGARFGFVVLVLAGVFRLFIVICGDSVREGDVVCARW